MLYYQRKPEGLSQYTHKVLDRTKLQRVGLDLDEEDLVLLDRLVSRSGLRKRTRFLRWLLWVWKELQDLEDGEGAYEEKGWGILVDDDPEHPVRLGYLKGNKFRGMKTLPDGWKKG